jgi:hypothetical protein
MARSIRPIQGVGRLGPTTSCVVLSPSDRYVVPYDGSKCPRVWRRFIRVVGPWILVLNMWWHLIRWEVLLLDWWGVMDTWHPMCQHVASWSSVCPTGPTWRLVRISLIRAPMYVNDISILIFSTSPLQWFQPICHFRLFMMMPYLCCWFTCSQLHHSMCISMCPPTKDRNTNTCGNCQYKPLF